MTHLEHGLPGCKTITEVLHLILQQAVIESIGISSIRYYRLRTLDNVPTFVSVACAGHEGYIPTQFELGKISKTAGLAEESQPDASFSVYQRSVLQLFQLEPGILTNSEPLRIICNYPMPFTIVQNDECDDFLGPSHARSPWIEIPLLIAGRVHGKLACTLSRSRIQIRDSNDSSLKLELDEIYRSAQSLLRMCRHVAPYLEALRAFDVNAPIDEASRAIFNCKSYEELYNYLVQTLPRSRPFNYEHADVFVTLWDTIRNDSDDPADNRDSELLILRASSYKPADGDNSPINRAHYRKHKSRRPWLDDISRNDELISDGQSAHEEGDGLTPWVWRNQQSIRLSEDANDPGFKKQLASYSTIEPISHARKVPLSDELRSLLIVPIPDPRKSGDQTRILGVLRFENRERRPEDGSTAIEPREELLLNRIATRCIGPKLVALKDQLFAESVKKHYSLVPLIRPKGEAESTTAVSVSRQLTETIDAFLPDHGKLVLLCRIRPDGKTYRPHVVLDTTTGKKRSFEHCYPLETSLTSIISSTAKKFVFVNDLRYAAYKGMFNHVREGLVCALGSPIRYADDPPYGAFIVLSSEYDLIPATYGPLTALVGYQLGLLLKRMEICDFDTQSVKAVRHDVPDLHSVLRDSLTRTEKLEQNRVESLVKISEFTNTLIRAYSVTAPPNPMEKDAKLKDVDPCRAVTAALEAAYWSCKSLSDEDWTSSFNFICNVHENVRVWSEFVEAAVYNLAKNALHESPHRKIDVLVFADAQMLQIEIANEFSDQTNNASKKSGAMVDDLDGQLLSSFFQDDMPAHMGISIVQWLTRWHRVRTKEGLLRGDLRYSKRNNKAVFEISFPLG